MNTTTLTFAQESIKYEPNQNLVKITRLDRSTGKKQFVNVDPALAREHYDERFKAMQLTWKANKVEPYKGFFE